MSQINLIVSTISLYSLAWICQFVNFIDWIRVSRFLVYLVGFFAVMMHAILLYHWIDLVLGQNLTLFNLFSLLVWLVALLLIVIALYRPLDILILFVFPMAILSILVVGLFPTEYIIDAGKSPQELFHVLLSVVTFAVLCLAGCQAGILAIQERLLRFKSNGLFINQLPPLVTMEKLLFQFISWGFALLSLLLMTSIYFFYPMWLTQLPLMHKTLIVSSAWVVFLVLILGHYFWGWRGNKAIYGTLFGVLLLILVYFGSKVLLEGRP